MGKRFQALFDPIVGIPIDVFFVLPPAQWGVIMTIRTGSADFNVTLMQTARRRNLRCEDGRLINTSSRGGIVNTPTEESFFEAIGVQWVSPEQRG
jgi:DNA polymerase/3'-5' exonuclease PolX